MSLFRHVHPTPAALPGVCRNASLRLILSRQLSGSRLSASELARTQVSEEEEEDIDLLDDAAVDEEAQAPSRPDGPSVRRDPGFKAWLGTVGQQWKDASTPRNWMGKDGAPFPLNPTFKPPIPISNAIRNTIYEEFMCATDPKVAFREIASKYHLSLARLDAILRLKGLEKHMPKEQLQTGFLAGMERILGVPHDASSRTRYPFEGYPEIRDEEHADMLAADAQDEAETDDMKRARLRYQRQFWEAVPEDQLEPQMPVALEKARSDAARWELRRESQRDEIAHTASQAREKRKDLVIRSGKAANRPLIRFKDVGSKLLDVKEEEKRQRQIERRSKIHARSREDQERRRATKHNLASGSGHASYSI